MIAAWMLYIALWSLWLSAAALLVERVLLAARLPVRGVWTVAVVLSMASPFVGATVPRHRAVLPNAPTREATASPMTVVRGAASVVPREASLRERVTRTMLAADRPLAAIWIGLSALMVCYLAGGVLHLRRVRREWRSDFLNGTPVLVSPDTGPAVIGVFRSAIVVPEWALALEPRAVALLLEHEKAHRAAGDVRLLALAQLAVVAMPWNLALWWQLRRLRVAVELDCDARVLRSTADVRAYGQLLLDCGEPPRAMSFGGAALIGHRTQLERRIEVMTKRASRGRASSSAASVAVGLGAVFAACQIPAPASPPASVTPPQSTPAAPVVAVRDTVPRQTPSAPQPVFVRGAVRPPADVFDSAFAAMQRLSAAQSQLIRDHFPTDSEAAVELEPACSVGRGAAGEALVKLLVSDAQANVGGRIDFVTAPIESGISVAVPSGRPETVSEYNKAQADLVAALMVWTDEHPTVKALRSKMVTLARERDGAIRCAGYGGEFRVFGQHAFDGPPIVVKAAIPTRVVVATGTGRVLVGPIVIANEDKSYALRWEPRVP